MHAPAIILGLAATVSAIDMYGSRSNEQCKGGDYIVCQNVNPNDCCIRASGNIFRSIGWRAIPTSWLISGNAYTGGDCSNIQYVAASNGADVLCAGGFNYSGGKYQVVGKKRSVIGDVCPAAGGCGSVKRGDVMAFADGTTYDLTGLDDALQAEMLSKRINPKPYPSWI